MSTPADNNIFKVNNRTSESRPGVFIVNFEHISHLVLVFLLLTLNMQLPAGTSLRQQRKKASDHK